MIPPLTSCRHRYLQLLYASYASAKLPNDKLGKYIGQRSAKPRSVPVWDLYSDQAHPPMLSSTEIRVGNSSYDVTRNNG